MNFNLSIDKNIKKPIYKQLLEELTEAISKGQLDCGDKLPSERELSEILGISRGTVKKVYEELMRNGLVSVSRGSGTFVLKSEYQKLKEDKAADLVDKLIENFFSLGLTSKEIECLVKARVVNKINSHKINSHKKINIAAIDCNVESLIIFKSQLKYLKNLNYMEFLLSDVWSFKHPYEVFENFDFIFTTTTHYNELINFIPDLEDKIIKAAVAPDKETVINIFNLPKSEEIGVLVKSERFGQIIRSNFKYYGFQLNENNYIYEDNLSPETFAEFIQNKKALVMPPLYVLYLKTSIYNAILNFYKNGNAIFFFNYTIEKGSLIHIEEKVATLF